jgi:septal ring factor EnvC (AmiA/AmiB activator)
MTEIKEDRKKERKNDTKKEKQQERMTERKEGKTSEIRKLVLSIFLQWTKAKHHHDAKTTAEVRMMLSHNVTGSDPTSC